MLTARLEVVAKPGARVAGIARRGPDVVVAIRAPSRVALVRGAGARRKLLACEGIDEAEVVRRIGVLPG